MQKIDGIAIAHTITDRLKKEEVPKKILAAILIGNNQASISFLKRKKDVAKKLGVDMRIYIFPETITQDEARSEMGKIANMKKVGGMIVQLPLPAHLSKHYTLNAIPREKDVDVLGERALGAFYADRNPVLPPSVGTLIEILNHIKNSQLSDVNRQLSATRVAVVGLGFLIGKPITHYLMGKCKELYLLDKESDLSIVKQADIVITGVGKPNLITPDMTKENAVIIDFGYSTENGAISGDFSSSSDVKSQTSNVLYTPVPGGTGPILVAKLLENFYTLNKTKK